MNLRRIAIALGVLTLVGAASAQCGRGPRTSEVTLPGFLSVYYEQFRSDAERDAAEFYGGVCVTAVGGDWTVLAERVLLSDLSAEVQLEAAKPELYFGPWRMTADALSANEHTLTLLDAIVDGPDARGGARVLEVDLASGEITLRGVVLAGSAFALRGEQAVMRGASLEVQAAGVTTCIGVEPVPFEIEGLRAEADLDARSVVLTGGTLRVGSLRIPLREDLELSEAAFARLELPVKVQVVQGDPAAPRYGDGLAVRVVGIPLGDGARLDVGATGLDAAYPLAAVALVRVEGPASGGGDAGGSESAANGAPDANGRAAPAESFAQATFGLEAGRPYLDAGVTRALTPWLDVRFGARSGAAPAQRARHEGVVALRAEVALPAVRGRVGGEAFAAATAVTPAAAPGAIVVDPEVFGTRVGAAVEGRVASGATAAGTFALDARTEVTLYPGHDVAQWGVMLAPAWRFGSGPFTATLAHDARLTNAASPFGVDVDRLVPRQRLTGTVRLAGVLLERPAWTLRGRAEARAAYDFVPVNGEPAGLRELRVTLRTTAEASPWRFEVGASSELAGLVDPATGRDAYVDVDAVALRRDWPVLIAATPERPRPPTPHGTFELGVRARLGLVTSGPATGTAAPSGLRRLELRTAVPLAFDTFEVRPFTAVDFAPTLLTGAAPIWSGWGVDVTFVTCCGSLTLGVVNDRGAWAASVAVDLERRPPSAVGVAADGITYEPASEPASGSAPGPTGIMSRSP